MFAPDIISLQQFYDSPFGQDVSALLCQSIDAMWPSMEGDAVLAVGYCNPFLSNAMAGAASLQVAMPADQGAAFWPVGKGNHVFMSQLDQLPLPDAYFNRVLLMHSVEHTESLSGLMSELWRVLVPGGRIMMVVPSRMGFWCHSSRSPFGYGRTFSTAQLKHLLAPHQFTVTRTRSALFMPPLPVRMLWRVAAQVEMVARVICPFVGGVLLLEAQKQIYASIKQPVHSTAGYAPPVRVRKPAMSRQP